MSWLTISKMYTTMGCSYFLLKKREITLFFPPFPLPFSPEKTATSGTEVRNFSLWGPHNELFFLAQIKGLR